MGTVVIPELFRDATVVVPLILEKRGSTVVAIPGNRVELSLANVVPLRLVLFKSPAIGPSVVFRRSVPFPMGLTVTMDEALTIPDELVIPSADSPPRVVLL